MSEENRKTHTSTEVKARYNAKVYSSLHFQLPKELVANFKAKCANEGVSQASIVKKSIEEYLAK